MLRTQEKICDQLRQYIIAKKDQCNSAWNTKPRVYVYIYMGILCTLLAQKQTQRPQALCPAVCVASFSLRACGDGVTAESCDETLLKS